jgi:hypothetical protein
MAARLPQLGDAGEVQVGIVGDDGRRRARCAASRMAGATMTQAARAGGQLLLVAGVAEEAQLGGEAIRAAPARRWRLRIAVQFAAQRVDQIAQAELHRGLT